MNTEALGWFMIGVGSLGMLHYGRALWRHYATPREPNPEPGPRVTRHTEMIDGWREERWKLEEAMNEMRDVLIEIRRLELTGKSIAPKHKAAVSKNLQTACAMLRDLNAAIAEDERANS